MKRTGLCLLAATLLCLLSATLAHAGDEGAISMGGVPTIADIKAPVTYFYADKVAYQPGESVVLKLTQNGNDNPFPFNAPFASYFIYLENMQTGEKRYFSAQRHSFLPVGEITEMFGNKATAASGNKYYSYFVPTIQDYVFFGPGGYFGGALPVPSEMGTYRYVMELRDTTGTLIQSQGFAPFAVVTGNEVLSGSINSDRTLTNDKSYLLNGIVYVEDGATLTIEPGTIIFGDQDSIGGLCIKQGGKINAVGTSSRPIIFTSASPVGQRDQGDWFGIAIAGRAPINVEGGVGFLEGLEGVQYGGGDNPDPHDNSGIMRYVRLEYAGIKFNPESEANGLYLNGVGDQTIIEYMHFNNNQDDNIEFFGGTVNVKYIYCTLGEDDQFDWTEGWSGKAQFIVTHVFSNTEGNRGIEADNLSSNHDATPRSNPQIYNMTIVGPRVDTGESEGVPDHGLMLRRGTSGNLHNFIVIGYGRDAINITDDATFAHGGLVFDNAILYNNGVFGPNGSPIGGGAFGNQKTKDYIDTHSKKVLIDTDPKLIDPYNELTPNYMPGYLSPAMRIDVVKVPPDDGFFEHVDFIGGIGPDYDWMAGGWIYVSPK
jgi:hypothetical protein